MPRKKWKTFVPQSKSGTLESSSDSESDHELSHDCIRKCHSSKDVELKVLQLVKICYHDALKYHIYRHTDKSSMYDDSVANCVENWAEWLQWQKQTNSLQSFDTVPIISFLSAVKIACNTNGIHKGVAIWLLHFFIKDLEAAALIFHKGLSSKSDRFIEVGMLTSSWKVLSVLLESSSEKIFYRSNGRRNLLLYESVECDP